MSNLPRLDRWRDLAGWDREDEFLVDFEDGINTEGCEAFVAAHPEFHKTDNNAALLFTWCLEREVPTTLRNLEVAYRELAAGMQQAPPPAPPEIDTTRGVVQVRNDVLAEYIPGNDEAAALEKVRDDPGLSDHARKKRDEVLRRLAGDQRRALGTGEGLPVVDQP